MRRRKMKGWSIISVVAVFTLLAVGFLNSAGRAPGVNEWEHLVIHLQQGAWWAIYICISFVCILVWWGLFFYRNAKKPKIGEPS